jgi:hypothetical protein
MIVSEALTATLFVLSTIGQTAGPPPSPGASELSVARYESIQEAIHANPGKLLYVPPGEYVVTRSLHIHDDNSGLWGPGRIVQTNPNVPVIQIQGAGGVQLRDLTLTRAAEKQDTNTEAVLAIQCRNLTLDNLRVLENRTRSAVIALRQCVGGQIRNCLLRNYMRISIDDRTGNQDWGYAFRCIDGSGILLNGCRGTQLRANRVVEHNLLPTPAVQQAHDLGRFVKKNAQKGHLVGQQVWDEEYVDNWHQGSAIVVTSPAASDFIQIVGNYIENAAQGIDIHADRVIISQNVIHNAFVGMKAMHGSRNILVIGNQFARNDLWAIGMMPGASSHAGTAAEPGREAIAPNVDGGSIIANNIISDFGYGHAHWIWGNERSPLRFDTGQKPENPPLADVIIQGNVVYRTDSHQPDAQGGSSAPPPRYRYAVSVASDVKGLHFSNNIFHAGTHGIANVELPP